MEQNVGNQVVGGSGAGGGLSGFLPGQSSSFTAEQIVDNPVPRPGGAGGLQGLPRGQSSTAFSEQIAEFPDPGGGLQDFQPVQGSAASPSVSPGQAGEGFFSHFSSPEKKCEDPAHPGVGTGCALELTDPMSLAGVWCPLATALTAAQTSWGTTWSAESSPCCFEARVVLPGLLLWFTLLPCGLEQPLVQAVRGCRALSAFGSCWKNSSSPLSRC